MAEMIADAKEMSVEDMEKEFLKVQADKPEAKSDVKLAGSSPAAEGKASKAATTLEEYQAQIDGLQKELARRKGQADKVEELEGRLAYMQGQMDAIAKSTKSDPIAEAVGKLDDETLITRHTEWQEELSSLRNRFDRAQEAGDNAAAEDLGSRIVQARKIIKTIQLEDRARTENKRVNLERQVSAGSQLKEELDSMFEEILELHPDFANQESELWTAGNEEYNAYPLFMERLGPASQIVAAAMAVIKHPELAGVKDTAAVRKDVVSKINKGLEHALSAGTKGTPGSTAPISYTVETGEGLAAFNRMVDRVKGG